MEEHEIDYYGVKIIVKGDFYPEEKGDYDSPPIPGEFRVVKVTVAEDTDISEFLDVEIIKEKILEEYYER